MDSPKAKLKVFLDHVNAVVRESFESYGSATNFPNAQTTQKDTGLNLQHKAMEYADEFVKDHASASKLDELASEVEGLILAGNSIGVLSEPETEQLVRELYDSKENR